MRGMSRRAMVVVGVVLALAGLAGCGGSSNPLGLPCNPQPHGALCIKVFRDGRKVTDAIGYLAASNSPLAGKTWRISLRAAGRTYPGPTRHGNPPRATFCRDANGTTVSTPIGCHDTLASAYASMGDFAGFDLPKSLPSNAHLCVFEQIEYGSSWRTVTTPASACTALS
jgi:hypothetical protein